MDRTLFSPRSMRTRAMLATVAGVGLSAALTHSVDAQVRAVALTSQVPSGWDTPRTAFGHPDIQGNWSTLFITPLERPPGMELVVNTEQAQGLVDAIFSVVACVEIVRVFRKKLGEDDGI